MLIAPAALCSGGVVIYASFQFCIIRPLRIKDRQVFRPDDRPMHYPSVSSALSLIMISSEKPKSGFSDRRQASSLVSRIVR